MTSGSSPELTALQEAHASLRRGIAQDPDPVRRATRLAESDEDDRRLAQMAAQMRATADALASAARPAWRRLDLWLLTLGLLVYFGGAVLMASRAGLSYRATGGIVGLAVLPIVGVAMFVTRRLRARTSSRTSAP